MEAREWNVLTNDEVSVSLVSNVIQKQRVLLSLGLRDVLEVLCARFRDGLHEPQRVWCVKPLRILYVLQQILGVNNFNALVLKVDDQRILHSFEIGDSP